MNIAIAVILLIIAAVVAYFAYRTANKANMYSLYVEAAKLSELSGGTPGFYRGLTNTSQPLFTPYGKRQCAYYTYSIERRVEDRNSDGSNSYRWEVESSGTSGSNPFFIQNNADYVVVYPGGINADDLTTETFDLNQVEGLGAVGDVINVLGQLSGLGRRVREHYYPVGATMSVGGQVFEENGQKIFRNDKQYPLVVTNKTKEMLVESGGKKSKLGYFVSFLFAAGAVAALVLIK